MKRPLIVVSGLKPGEAESVLPWLSRARRPLYLEATSRLRGHEHLVEWEMQGRDKMISRLNIDGVIRIGNVPTFRFWRDLESSQIPVWNFSNAPFSGLPREPKVEKLGALKDPQFEEWDADEIVLDRTLGERRSELLVRYPLSEPAWVNRVSIAIPAGARVFLGNSLPIREWDFAAHSAAASDVFANRGTNGIDGLISTFAGVASETAQNWALLGDLSALYDMSGPWALRQRPLKDFNLVILNNGGGQIFNRMFRDPMFLNSHDLRFENWAKMWDLAYTALRAPQALKSGRQVIEILPDPADTEAFWEEWDKV